MVTLFSIGSGKRITYLSTSEAAEIIGVNASRVRQLVYSGKLRAVKHKGELCLTPQDVRRFSRIPRLLGRPVTSTKKKLKKN